MKEKKSKKDKKKKKDKKSKKDKKRKKSYSSDWKYNYFYLKHYKLCIFIYILYLLVHNSNNHIKIKNS